MISTKPSDRIRILYVHNSADTYGASRSLLRLLGTLDRTRYEPLVVLPEEGPLKARLEDINVPVCVDSSLAIIDRYAFLLTLFCYRFPVSVLRLTRLIRRARIDLVHTNTAVIFSPGVAARLSGIPHVWHVRESFDEFPRPLWRLYSRYMSTLSNKLVCVSNAVARQFAGSGKIAVIHNGFSLDEFAVDQKRLREQFRRGFGINETDFVVACVGRIKWKRKGQEFLVQAIARLRDSGVRVVAVVAGLPWPGNESQVQGLRALVEELNLQDRVILTGEFPDSSVVYAGADVLVLPSAQPEPFAGVVMEAMVMEKPVIATAVGGSLDQVVDGETGYLIPPGDPVMLAEKIRLLMADPEMRSRMGKAGAIRVRDVFNLRQMVEKMEGVYREVLAR